MPVAARIFAYTSAHRTMPLIVPRAQWDRFWTAAAGAAIVTHLAAFALAFLWKAQPQHVVPAMVVELTVPAPAVEPAPIPVPVPVPDPVTATAPPPPTPVPIEPPPPPVIESQVVAAEPPPPPRPRPVPPRPVPPIVVEKPPEPPPRIIPAPVQMETRRSAPAVAAGPPPDYLARVRAQIERRKVYPRTAQSRRQEGTVSLRFTINREGGLVNYRIGRSSGYAALDDAVEQLIQRAAPFPPIPDEIATSNLELVIPIDYFLR